MKRWSSAAALALVMLVAAPAAADLSPKEEAKRTQLFREGKALADAGQWKEAAEKFREVVELRSAPKALIALGYAEQNVGRLSEAKRLFEKAREDAVAGKLKADEEAAAQALRQLLPRVPRISVKLPSDAKDASITIDGKPAELQFGDADVDPGEHAVTATAAGRKDFSATVTVAEGERKEVQVVLEPLAVAPPPPPPDTGRGPPPLGAIVLAGVGVGAGIAGAVLWGVARGEESDVEQMCGGIKECPATLKASADSAATKIIVGDVLVGVGGAAIIGGAVWWLAAGHSSPPPASGAAAPRVLVSPTRGGAWAGIQGSF